MTERYSGERIYLRKLTVADASENYRQWLNDPEVNFFLETRQASLADLREYINQKNTNPDALLLGVFDKRQDVHIGNVKLEPIDWHLKKAEFGIIIGHKQYWGQGLGLEAAKLTLDYAFEKLGLTEIELAVISENLRARKTFEKAGFREAKFVRQAHNHNGVWFDKIIMVKRKGA